MAKKEKENTSGSSSEKEKTTNPNEKAGFWDETKENVTVGAKILSEEAKQIGEKIAKYSETIFGKIKDNTNEVIKYGFDLTNEGVHKAQEMAENLKDDFEIKKLNGKKKDVSAQLGMKFYLAIKNNANKVPANLIKNKEVVSLLKELEETDKEILKLSELKNKK
ncbi:MAG: hypothetical protein C0597_12595 [Marinilabiliales bacterium]|nr:MAG: hypothetical protein C0597_12595 [Marinilabiliales bacterium]